MKNILSSLKSLLIVSLTLSLVVTAFPQRADAIKFAGPVGTQGYLYIEPNSSGTLPGLLEDTGGSARSNQYPVTWTSSDQSMLTISGSTYTSLSQLGDVTVVVITAKGETASFTYRIRRLTRFMGVPQTNSIPAIPSIFPGLTYGASITGLVTQTGNDPISGVNVRFFGIDPNTSNQVAICNGTTNASGNSSCNGLVLQAFYMFCAHFDGNATYAPTPERCNVE